MASESIPLPKEIVASDAVLAPATSIAFTEGPAAHADGSVFFSDIMNNRILRFDPSAKTFSVWRSPSHRANGLLFDPQGRLLACEGNEMGSGEDGGRRITRTDLVTGEVDVLTDRFEGKRYNSPNDVAACSNGFIFFTDPCYGDRATMELSHDSVYRIDPDSKVSLALTQPEIQRPNGIALSPDEKTLYLVDRKTQH